MASLRDLELSTRDSSIKPPYLSMGATAAAAAAATAAAVVSSKSSILPPSSAVEVAVGESVTPSF